MPSCPVSQPTWAFGIKATRPPAVVVRLKEADAPAINTLLRDSRRTPGVFAGIDGQRDGLGGGGVVLKESEGRGTGSEG